MAITSALRSRWRIVWRRLFQQAFPGWRGTKWCVSKYLFHYFFHFSALSCRIISFVSAGRFRTTQRKQLSVSEKKKKTGEETTSTQKAGWNSLQLYLQANKPIVSAEKPITVGLGKLQIIHMRPIYRTKRLSFQHCKSSLHTSRARCWCRHAQTLHRQ